MSFSTSSTHDAIRPASRSRRQFPRVRRALLSGLAGSTALSLTLSSLLLLNAPPSSGARVRAAAVGAEPVARPVPRIAYTGSRTDIFTVYPDGSGQRQRTFSGRASSPSWSPSGHRLAFAENGEIWVLWGYDLTRITSGAAGTDGEPQWSPDGRRIAFTRQTADGSRIMVYDFDTATATAVTGPTEQWPLVRASTWSPDGTRIAFVRVHAEWDADEETTRYFRQLFVMGADGSDLQPVPHTSSPDDPSWSPDGERLLYTYTYADLREECDAAVVSVRLDGTGKRIVLHQGCESRAGSWSPSGSRIVVFSNGPGDDIVRDGAERAPKLSGVWTLRPDGTHRRLVVRDAREPVWQPQAIGEFTPGSSTSGPRGEPGPRLAYSATTPKGLDIFTINPDGTGRRQLTDRGDARFPAWSPDRSKIAYVAGHAIWVMGPRGGHKRRIVGELFRARDPAWSPDGTRIVWADGWFLRFVNLSTRKTRSLRVRGRPGC